MLSGELGVRVEDVEQVLKTGDAIYFDAASTGLRPALSPAPAATV